MATVAIAPRRVMLRDDVETIQRLAEEGCSTAAIAGMVGWSRPSVRRALRTAVGEWPDAPRPVVVPDPRDGSGTRKSRAALRVDLCAGRATLADVLLPVHPALASLLLFDVVRMQWPDRRRERGFEDLGAAAVSSDVNLFLRVDRASERSRRWVAERCARTPWRGGV
jgi:hypothetical protein